MGLNFPENFNYPYISRSITEFWRRWHISLSSWFRDYLYIPLGGNRVSPARIYGNLLIVFVLCGFWHGASWNFLVWGLLHGAFLIAERFFRSSSASIRFPVPMKHVYVLCVAIFTWVPFRSVDLAQTIDIWRTLVGGGECTDATLRPILHYWNLEVAIALVAGLFGSTPIGRNVYRRCREYASKSETSITWIFEVAATIATMLIMVYCAMLMASGAYSPFIYFRF